MTSTSNDATYLFLSLHQPCPLPFLIIAVNEVYFYRRHTHGLHAFVVRAECAISGGSGGDDAAAVAEKAKEAAAELKAHLAGSEFLKSGGMAFDATVLHLVVNTDGPKILENQFGVV